jgi:hypothetical protein
MNLSTHGAYLACLVEFANDGLVIELTEVFVSAKSRRA